MDNLTECGEVVRMGTCLVGRVAEVVALDELRAAAEHGSGAVALLTGEAGIGKTAVVEEAVSRASAAGVTVLTGRADPDEGAPAFWPWLRLLDSDVDGLSPSLLALTDAGEPAELLGTSRTTPTGPRSWPNTPSSSPRCTTGRGPSRSAGRR